jgi:NitT/TauT family transport system permease protein
MLHRRLYQFIIVYAAGLSLLFVMKYVLKLSDYVIPSPLEIWQTVRQVFTRYRAGVIDTVGVAVIGHMLSIFLAAVVGIVAGWTSWIGLLVRAAAYNIQAYPIVALAPIIFILFGDGLMSRLLITAMICYFPLLLTFIGVLTEPVDSVEHFFRGTGSLTWPLQVKIRVFENVGKLTTVIAGSATMAMVGTIVAEFIAANAGIGYSIRIALYQSDLAKILVALLLIGVATSVYLALLEWLGEFVRKKIQAENERNP